ncbi:MAG: putative two-component system sensor kinase, partial [Actinotalea sp.]|nr:putative two-component system sensor kinase [Actinotalea sp.]
DALAGEDRQAPGAGLAAVMGTTLSRTAFRVVQEALTNARKHAPRAPVEVRLSGAPGGHLEVEVRNRLVVGAGPSLPSAGVGLLGLRERAELAGGSLRHGPQPDGTFLVHARLPWDR